MRISQKDLEDLVTVLNNRTGNKYDYDCNEIIIYQPTITFATNKGWHTRTTTNRLNKLTDMSFRIRQGVHQYCKAKSTEWYELSYEGVTDIMVGVI